MFQFDKKSQVMDPNGDPTSMFNGLSFSPRWAFYWVNWVTSNDRWDLECRQYLELNVQTVRGMVHKQTDEMWIESIQIVTPPTINDTDTWKLDLLHEVWLPVASAPGNFEEMFVTSGGTYRSDTLASGAKTYCYLNALSECGSAKRPEAAV